MKILLICKRELIFTDRNFSTISFIFAAGRKMNNTRSSVSTCNCMVWRGTMQLLVIRIPSKIFWSRKRTQPANICVEDHQVSLGCIHQSLLSYRLVYNGSFYILNCCYLFKIQHMWSKLCVALVTRYYLFS